MSALASLREAESRPLSEACLDAVARNASTITNAKEPAARDCRRNRRMASPGAHRHLASMHGFMNKDATP